MASVSSNTPAPALPTTVAATLAAIATTLQLVNSPPTDPNVANSQTYTPISLYAYLADMANLAKAHSTKLGLLSNPPIAESSYPAIARILLDVTNSILPVASSAPFIASKERYGSITNDAVVKGVTDLLKGFEEMVGAVENSISDGAATVVSSKGKERQVPTITDLRDASTATKSSYTSTGQIWFSSDALLAISQKHLIGLVEKKLQSHADMLNDCISEFKDWVTDAADELNGEDSGFDEDESQSNSVHADLAQDDDFFGLEGQGRAKITKEILAAAEVTQKKLKLTSILYTAMLKRRVKDPATRLGGIYNVKETLDDKEVTIEREKNANRLETLVEKSSKLVEKADDLAASFYDGEDAEVVTGLRDEVVRYASELAAICKLNKEGNEDTPSAWFGKFVDNISL